MNELRHKAAGVSETMRAGVNRVACSLSQSSSSSSGSGQAAGAGRGQSVTVRSSDLKLETQESNVQHWQDFLCWLEHKKNYRREKTFVKLDLKEHSSSGPQICTCTLFTG